MTRYERFRRMIGAEITMPWLAAVAGMFLGKAWDEGTAQAFVVWVILLILVVCVVYVIAFVIDTVKRIGLAIARSEDFNG